MWLAASSINIDQHDSSDPIFNHNNQHFYDHIKQIYSDDLAGLISFAVSRNKLHLVEMSCDDILLIFKQEVKEINKLWQLCCFKIRNDKYEIKFLRSINLTIGFNEHRPETIGKQ